MAEAAKVIRIELRVGGRSGSSSSRNKKEGREMNKPKGTYRISSKRTTYSLWELQKNKRERNG